MANPHVPMDIGFDSWHDAPGEVGTADATAGAAAVAGTPLSRLRRFMTTLGGAQDDLLARARVDVGEMTARGIAALIPAVFGALAGTVTLADAYGVSLAGALPVGLAWGVVLLLFDLSLMSAAPGRSIASRLVVLGSRAVVSILAALTIAGSLVLGLYSIDIAVQVRADQQAGLADYTARYITPRYEPVIAHDQHLIAADLARVTSAQAAVAAATGKLRTAHLAVVCEENGVSNSVGCSRGTGRFGVGPAAQVRLAEWANAKAALAAAKAGARSAAAQYRPQLTALQSAVAGQQRQEQSAYAMARARYLDDSGLIARWRALAQLESSDSGVRIEVILFEALIIAVDLSAVLTKLSSRTPAYDRIVQAAQTAVTLDAGNTEDIAYADADRTRARLAADAAIHDATQDARVEVCTTRIRAETYVALCRIDSWVRAQTGGPGQASSAGQGASPGHDAAAGRWEPGSAATAQNRSAQSGRVQAPSLSQFAGAVKTHEQQSVAMAAPLARAAWLGVALLSALIAAMLLLHAMHATIAGTAISALALATAVALAVYSRGFRRGPSWAHRAAFGVAIVGLAMPAIVTALNI